MEGVSVVPTCPAMILPKGFPSLGAGEPQPGHIRHFGAFCPSARNHVYDQLGSRYTETNYPGLLSTHKLKRMPGGFWNASLHLKIYRMPQAAFRTRFCPFIERSTATSCMGDCEDADYDQTDIYSQRSSSAPKRPKRSSVSSSHPHSCLDRYWSPTSHSAFCRYFER